MKKITDINSEINITENNNNQQEISTHVPLEIKNLVDAVFKNIRAIKPAWKISFPDKETVMQAKAEWTKSFYENGINTIPHIEAGMVGARSDASNFWPSCGQFVSWCKPSFKSAGWPEADKAIKLCISHRATKGLFPPPKMAARPLIVKLCESLDWHYMKNKPEKLVEAHFNERYMVLLTSGYVEPLKSNCEALPMNEVISAGMSVQQKADEKERRLSFIRNIKKKVGG
jgi:hypothetical protein